jgi:hypothetical protein
MYRRRHRAREIPFSFDSFLDVVANIVGIIVRLILVVWFGARAYTGIQQMAARTPTTEAALSTPAPTDPLESELAQRRRELDELQERLAKQLEQLQLAHEETTAVTGKLSALTSQEDELQRAAAQAHDEILHGGDATRAVALSSNELREKCQQLSQQIKELEQLPTANKVLRYRTPVSRPIQSEELLFEVHHDRVTFIDLAPLMAEVKREMGDRKEELKHRWQVEGRTPAAGAFRLHYILERDRGMFDVMGAGAAPDPGETFSFGLSIGELEPVAPERGEDLQRAMGPQSEFRQIVDLIDPQQTTVTLWVYPDSFGLYRALRDYLVERNIIVAGRPLPEGVPIGCSRRGTVSRGQ